jgi:copper chaperone
MMSEFTLSIDGMHCESCVRRATQALSSIEGVEVQEVRIGAARLSTTLEPPPAEAAISALAKAGYKALLEQ